MNDITPSHYWTAAACGAILFGVFAGGSKKAAAPVAALVKEVSAAAPAPEASKAATPATPAPAPAQEAKKPSPEPINAIPWQGMPDKRLAAAKPAPSIGDPIYPVEIDERFATVEAASEVRGDGSSWLLGTLALKSEAAKLVSNGDFLAVAVPAQITSPPQPQINILWMFPLSSRTEAARLRQALAENPGISLPLRYGVAVPLRYDPASQTIVAVCTVSEKLTIGHEVFAPALHDPAAERREARRAAIVARRAALAEEFKAGTTTPERAEEIRSEAAHLKAELETIENANR